MILLLFINLVMCAVHDTFIIHELTVVYKRQNRTQIGRRGFNFSPGYIMPS